MSGSAIPQQVCATQVHDEGMTETEGPPTVSSGAAYLGRTGIMPIFAPEARMTQALNFTASEVRVSDILPTELQESFIETYREYCWPWCPVLDADTIQTSLEANPSPLLMNALALLGTRIRPPMMQHAGSAEYYRRAKMLFYGDEEANHIVCLQSILLFYWWAPKRYASPSLRTYRHLQALLLLPFFGEAPRPAQGDLSLLIGICISDQ